MKKTLCQALQVITHLATCFFLQGSFLSMFIWYYELTGKTYAMVIAATFVLSALDFIICDILPYSVPKRLHFADLILLLPTLICMGIRVVQMFQHKSIETLPLDITILLLNCLIVFERILLAKKTGKKTAGETETP